MAYSTKILKPEVDAATVNMGSNWKMPTLEDYEELRSYTNYETVEIDGVAGEKFTSKIDSSKYIFIPFAGVAMEGFLMGQGTTGSIWSSSASPQWPDCAYYLDVQRSASMENADSRSISSPIRGVC